MTFASAFSFKYSPRPGTPGADLPDQVTEDVKVARLAELQELLDAPAAGVQRQPGWPKLLLFCSRKRGGMPVKSPAGLPIYSLFRSRRPKR